MAINQDFKEFIQCLNANEVKYLVVGGYAVAFHGHPRYTKDLDIWIGCEAQNADRILKALNDFGFGSLDLTADDFLDPDMVVQLGQPPARIDVIAELQGVEFSQCFENRIELELDDIIVNLIDIDSLKRNKRATGRNQDLADLENLT